MPKTQAGKPLVSVITPCLNSEATISGTVKSVLNQSMANLEHMIVDGGSEDRTLEILKGFGDGRLRVSSSPDRGIYDAMNKGVAKAAGEWMIFLGADDRLRSRDILERVFRRDFPGVDYIFGNVEYDTGEVFRSVSGMRMLLKNSVHHQSVFYNRRVFEDFMYDDKNGILGDFELNLALYMQKASYARVDEIISLCAEGGVSRKADFMGYRNEIRIRKKHLPNGFLVTLLNIQTLLRFIAKKGLIMAGRFRSF